jgi:hypothetical protein
VHFPRVWGLVKKFLLKFFLLANLNPKSHHNDIFGYFRPPDYHIFFNRK